MGREPEPAHKCAIAGPPDANRIDTHATVRRVDLFRSQPTGLTFASTSSTRVASSRGLNGLTM